LFIYQVKKIADSIDEAAKELPDANLVRLINTRFVNTTKYGWGTSNRNLWSYWSLEDLWANHSKPVLPKPHMKDTASWRAIQKVCYTPI